MGHRSAWTKIQKENEKPREAEMEVDDAVPQEASVAIQSPKRKVIRVIRQEEAEEMGFLPSALSEPRGPFYWRQSMQ